VRLPVRVFQASCQRLKGVPCAAENFANRSQASSEDEKVLRLADMGFSKDAAIVALQTANGDENSALELLLAAI